MAIPLNVFFFFFTSGFLFFFSLGYLRDNKVELLTNISFYAHMNSHFFVATQTQNVMNTKEGVEEGETFEFRGGLLPKLTLAINSWLFYLIESPLNCCERWKEDD